MEETAPGFYTRLQRHYAGRSQQTPAERDCKLTGAIAVHTGLTMPVRLGLTSNDDRCLQGIIAIRKFRMATSGQGFRGQRDRVSQKILKS